MLAQICLPFLTQRPQVLDASLNSEEHYLPFLYSLFCPCDGDAAF